MNRLIKLLAIACCLSLLGGVPSVAMAAESTPTAKKKASGPMMRILCVASLSENEKVVVVSKNDEGEWVEHGEVTLRSSFITPWMKAPAGNLHLAKRGAEGPVSIGKFKLSKNTKRSILVLLPNLAKKSYSVDVIDPADLGFRKGMALVTNYSKMTALVMLGSKRAVVKPGKRVAERAVAGKDGMYRMVIGYQDEKTNKVIPCYDRYIPLNPDARDFLLLFPDPTAKLKVYSLSEFGPFD